MSLQEADKPELVQSVMSSGPAVMTDPLKLASESSAAGLTARKLRPP